MKITKYEYLKYVFVFANIYSAFLVYFFVQRISQEDTEMVLPITVFSVAVTAVMSYIIFRISPNIKKTREEQVTTKLIALTILEFLVLVVGTYFVLSNPQMLFPGLFE